MHWSVNSNSQQCCPCCPSGTPYKTCCCNPGCYPWWIAIAGNSQLLNPDADNPPSCSFTSADGTATLSWCYRTKLWTLKYGGNTYTSTSSACPPASIGSATLGCPPSLGKTLQCAVSGCSGTWWYCNPPLGDGGNGLFCAQSFSLDGTIVLGTGTYGSPCSDNFGVGARTGSASYGSPCNCYNAFYSPATPDCSTCVQPTLNTHTGNTQPCQYNGSPVPFSLSVMCGHSPPPCPCTAPALITWFANAALFADNLQYCSICLTGTVEWDCETAPIPLPSSWTEVTGGCGGGYGDQPTCWTCPSTLKLTPSMFTFEYAP